MDTKVYLGNVVELEKNIYTLNKTIHYLKSSQENLGIANCYEYPEIQTDNGFIVNVIACIAATLFSDFFTGVPIGIVYGLYKLMHGGTFWSNFALCIIVIGVIWLLIWIWNCSATTKHDHEEFANKIDTYYKLVEKDELRVKKELKKKDNINLQIAALQNKKMRLLISCKNYII